MKFDVLTLFPEMFEPMKESIIGRAIDKNLIQIHTVNMRDFSKDKHKKVDDTVYGGGAGMLIRPDIVYDAYQSVKSKQSKVIFLSPQGKTLTQKKVLELAKEEHLILLCGHYEGIDQRVIDKIVDEEISIGDYVLTGGELPAMVLIDSVSRYVDGVLANESKTEESFSNGLLEYPQYTRPEVFEGERVPEVLLSRTSWKYWKMAKKGSLKKNIWKTTRFIGKNGFVGDEEWQILKDFSISEKEEKMDILKSIEHEQMKNKIPELKVGNTVRVHAKVKEGNRERIQVFEGIIIKKQGGGVNATFTVRKISYGVGVEKTFLVHSPRIEKIEVVRVGRARRAKLYYLRDRVGKAAKTKEQVGARIETKEITVKEEIVVPEEGTIEEAPVAEKVAEEVVETVNETSVEEAKEVPAEEPKAEASKETDETKAE